MAATGTKAVRGKCIPAGAATFFEEFWIVARRTIPAMRRLRLPFAERAADAAEVGKISFLLAFLGERRIRLRTLQQKQEDDYPRGTLRSRLVFDRYSFVQRGRLWFVTICFRRALL